MPHFINSPNLPQGQVAVVAVGEDYAEEIAKALLPYGIRTLSCPNNHLVDVRLRAHIDLSVIHIGENRFILSDATLESGFADALIKMGADIIVSEAEFSSEYPNDAALCALAAGDRLFHNFKCSDRRLKDMRGYKYIHVNQGYTKCAVCLLSPCAAITADKGLSKAMKYEEMDVLEIAPGGIALEGFKEGFIGGAVFKISRDKLAFTGTLEGHPDKTAIEAFLKVHGITPIYLTDKPVFDVGSVLPITEL